MKSYETIQYKGKQILTLNLMEITAEERIAFYQGVHKEIEQNPPKSVLILTDASNIRFTVESAAALKEFATKNTPYVKASAVVGTEGLKEVIRIAIERATLRDIKPFTSRQEALDWLVEQ